MPKLQLETLGLTSTCLWQLSTRDIPGYSHIRSAQLLCLTCMPASTTIRIYRIWEEPVASVLCRRISAISATLFQTLPFYVIHSTGAGETPPMVQLLQVRIAADKLRESRKNPITIDRLKAVGEVAGPRQILLSSYSLISHKRWHAGGQREMSSDHARSCGRKQLCR